MVDEYEITEFLLKHLNSIKANDVPTYHETSHPDLTLYEWWITPHRIDGLGFHDFMMESNAARGSVFGVEAGSNEVDPADSVRFDLSNLRIQQYDNLAIATYTLIMSAATPDGVQISSHNETRVMIKFPEGWQVVHVHKSPAWQAPHQG
jgi:hypothetical protein